MGSNISVPFEEKEPVTVCSVQKESNLSGHMKISLPNSKKYKKKYFILSGLDLYCFNKSSSSQKSVAWFDLNRCYGFESAKGKTKTDNSMKFRTYTNNNSQYSFKNLNSSKFRNKINETFRQIDDRLKKKAEKYWAKFYENGDEKENIPYFCDMEQEEFEQILKSNQIQLRN
ncbi:signal-transducing adaptor protein-related [Anaeramoeba flamelloides]|uniref:Signal-transducing adaptor protein-related n=1 Tax=Anaeramoeba flamelloides TaxID=1746091 RepID=A0ABQ8YXN6_9EUKA|nr:signal-transducing adaptor protein-related [Anaeramoeba flamelloides]